HEMPEIIRRAVEAGASQAMYIMCRLPYGVKDLFQDWLGVHYPDRKEKVLNRIREIRGGKLNDSTFGERMRGAGIFAEQVRALFHASCRREGIEGRRFALSAEAFRQPGSRQMCLF
ncbi:MAG TPA: radical SAM protein, partial [Calditrichia bacterium]|nr:radical SAM protein [Calditrichia bacterium]